MGVRPNGATVTGTRHRRWGGFVVGDVGVGCWQSGLEWVPWQRTILFARPLRMITCQLRG